MLCVYSTQITLKFKINVAALTSFSVRLEKDLGGGGGGGVITLQAVVCAETE